MLLKALFIIIIYAIYKIEEIDKGKKGLPWKLDEEQIESRIR